MKSKKFHLFTVLFLLLFVLISGVSLTHAASYPDVDNTPYKTAVETLSSMRIVTGYPDGTFQPERSVTRAEFAAMVTKYLGIPESDLKSYNETKFKDMAGYGWSISYMGYCSENGIILGDGKGNAMPGKTITYVEAATMVVRVLGLEPELNPSLKWPANYLEVATNHGLTNNISNRSGTMDRGNAAQLLYNALGIDSSYKGTLTVSKMSLYSISDGADVNTYEFARNIDTDIKIKFTVKHDLISNNKTVPLQFLISPVIEKKVIENETKYIKLEANNTSTEATAIVSIKNLVKDNPNVNQYKIEIKANDIILNVKSFELYLDTSEEKAFIEKSTMQSIKFYSGTGPDWIPYEDRVYAVSFLKTPLLGMIAADAVINHDIAPRDMIIPITHIYYFGNGEFAKYNRNLYIPKGSTSTLVSSGIYYSEFATKKYQAGKYTVKTFAFDKLIAEGQFTVVTK